MNFIKNLSIRNKLLLIAIVPLLALFFFLMTNISAELEAKAVVAEVQREVEHAEALSSVIHNLQQERGYSMSYLISNGSEDRSELFSQREQTNKAITVFNRLISDGDSSLLNLLEKRLPMLRAGLDQFKTGPDRIQEEFAGINLVLIDDVQKTALYSRNPEVKQLLNAHLFIMYGKEYFGALRNELSQAILQEGFQNQDFATFSALRGKFEMNLESFRKSTSADLAALLVGEMENGNVMFARKIIDAASEDPEFQRFAYTSDSWWTAGVAFLNSLKKVEDHSSLAIGNAAELQLEAISTSVLHSILIAVLLLLIIGILLYSIITTLVSSVVQMKNAAERIAAGDLGVALNVNAGDEIGNLANAFRRLVSVSKEYAETARAIGNGDYSVDVNVRSNVDTLGLSLNTMKDNLLRLSKENQERTWLLSGSGELNDRIRGDKDLREVAGEIIAHLTEYLNAQVGAIYLADNGQLMLAGTYAFGIRKDNSNVIRLGEGLVGQAAIERKPITFTNVPHDYIRISSGLGDAVPRNIIVYPFQYEEELKGVIEIGSVNPFTSIEMEFLRVVAESIAIAVNSAQSRTLQKELLEETQRQTEELEAQSEELRQINEELQEKTDLLEKSEAELRAQQEELQQTNEELEEKASLLEEQKEALEVAKMEVESKARQLEVTSRYKSEFLANMSHELRTPLNSILILAQLLSENKTKALAEREVGFARNIYSSGTDLLNLINEILDLSKVESGKIELDIANVNLLEIQDSLQSLFRELAKTKGTAFEISVNTGEIGDEISTDRQRLEQILRNLLSNAFKFTGKGGEVTVDISTVNLGTVAPGSRLARQGKVVAFSVTDTGIGIPPEKQHVIFEAFQQADGSTKRKYGGTGLGLSISRELANALGGEIVLKSEEGAGSTFTLYLPVLFDASMVVQTEKEVAVRKPLSPEPAQPAARRVLSHVPGINGADLGEAVSDDRFSVKENDRVILIVEDDRKFAGIILDFVRSRDYKGILAHQGNTALSLARYYRPDAIILDMKLPMMDGSQVLKHLKNDPELRHIPVQVISGYDRRKEGYELGAFDFIRKPLDNEGLQKAFSKIEEFISKKLKKLLVVEDNKEQNMAIRELVGDGDVKSYPAYTGAEAYEIMQKEKFDCVIIDLGLPDMGGIDLMEKLKADERLKSVPVIVYTGKDLTRDEAGRLNKLANTVVLKTADSNERLLDETTLFLHRVESKLPKEKQEIIRRLHRTDEVLKNKKVLIVDDDMRNIYSLTNALEEEGVKCITAENGRAAVQILNEQPDTDIILMDVMMPDMDGYEATREIRSKNRFGKLPIIALTAKAMKGDREKCLEAGMSDYIAKPVDIEKLLSLMRVWLYR
ncbi:MAG TPA: response regulator [Sphingobacteriaceae bacterium]